MLDTNDVFNDAVRGSTIHMDEDTVQSRIGSKVVAMLLLSSIAVVGFNFYKPVNSDDTNLVVKTAKVAQNTLLKKNEVIAKNELIAKIQTKSEQLVVAQVSDSEEEYLNALRGIENELNEERETVNLNAEDQLELSSAMSSLVDDSLADASDYAQKLKQEIGVESDKPLKIAAVTSDKTTEDCHAVIVKKGDTLQGISSEYYGDAMDYKRIIASNDSLRTSDTIYEGQTIILPY